MRHAASAAGLEQVGRRVSAAAAGALTLTNKYSANLDANRRTPGSIRRQSSLQTGRRARFRREGAPGALGGLRLGLGPGGRRIGAPPPACVRGAAARRPHYMSLCGERAPRALVTDSQRRRRPTVCPTTVGARCTAPLHSACPRCSPRRRARPPRPEEFSASGGKNRLCSEPRIISARRTAPLRPPAAAPPPPYSATVKRTAFHSMPLQDASEPSLKHRLQLQLIVAIYNVV